MATTVSLTAQPRDVNLTPRALRRTQKVPGVIYGRAYAPKSLQFDYPVIERALRRAGTSRFVALSVEGEQAPQTALVRDIQRDPVTSRILHVDLYAIVAGQRVRNQIPLVQRGKAPAVALGGSVSQIIETLDVECLPEDMPEFIEIDVNRLETLHSRITVADLVISPSVTVMTSTNTVVANISVPHLKAEVEVEVKVAAEAGAPAEGEAAKTEEPSEQK
jgi:large subunit ribosomal protein L25